MMEMNWDTVRFYFDHIHRCVKTGGLFYCVNRYHKSTSGQDIRIRDYPFDGYWQLLLSQACWAQTHIHELLVQRCRACGKYQFYPRRHCAHCFTLDGMEWVKSSGKGTVYSFTVTYQNRAPGFKEDVPYVLAYVNLEEGVRMMTNVVGCKPEDVRIDMPVEVVFEDATPEVSVPKFRPAPR